MVCVIGGADRRPFPSPGTAPLCRRRMHATATCRAGGDWEFSKLEVGRSDLPEGQAAVAARCMQEAVAGTRFPAEERDEGETYLINWSWPVPLPANAEQ